MCLLPSSTSSLCSTCWSSRGWCSTTHHQPESMTCHAIRRWDPQETPHLPCLYPLLLSQKLFHSSASAHGLTFLKTCATVQQLCYHALRSLQLIISSLVVYLTRCWYAVRDAYCCKLFDEGLVFIHQDRNQHVESAWYDLILEEFLNLSSHSLHYTGSVVLSVFVGLSIFSLQSAQHRVNSLLLIWSKPLLWKCGLGQSSPHLSSLGSNHWPFTLAVGHD